MFMGSWGFHVHSRARLSRPRLRGRREFPVDIFPDYTVGNPHGALRRSSVCFHTMPFNCSLGYGRLGGPQAQLAALTIFYHF